MTGTVPEEETTTLQLAGLIWQLGNFNLLWLGPCCDSTKRAPANCEGTTSVVPECHPRISRDFSPERSAVLDPVRSPDRQSSKCSHWPFQREDVLRRSAKYRLCGLHNLACHESHDQRIPAAIFQAKSLTLSPLDRSTPLGLAARPALR